MASDMPKSSFPVRVTLGIMGFFMFLVTQMIRVNLYIAMVPINEERLYNNGTGSKENAHNWDQNASGLLLSAFYWGYWATELPGGLLAQKFGGRRVLAVCVTLAGVLNLALPFAVDVHYLLAAVVRALQGLCLGVTWPVMHWLSARWIPSTERSKFMTVYHGAAIGTAITYPLSGLVILHLGWRWVFYATSFATFAWSLAWLFHVYDSPSAHPRISLVEEKYLQEAIGGTIARKGKITTPWKGILHSRPFWGVLMASQGLMWGTITISMQTPLYFRHLHQLDIKTIGYFSGVPEICKFLFSLIFSYFIDNLLQTKRLSITAARKLAVIVCECLPAIFLAILAFFGTNDVNLALTILALTSAVGGASSSGSLANIVDLSPNHAGTILGLIKTLTIVPGVISPLIATHLTRPGVEPPSSGWQHVWLLAAFIYAVCCLSFQICGSGEVQPWNHVEEKKNPADFELLVVTKTSETVQA